MGIPAEEQECITNYLNRGGSFSNVQTPVIFIKRLLDHKTLRAFLPALDKAIKGGMTHCTRTIVETLNNVLVGRMPKRGRLTKFFQKNKTVNAMGDRGENLMTYSKALIRDLHESGWEDMTTQEAGVLIWLTDLTASNPYQVKLSEKIHLAWDAAIAKEEMFGVINCISIASDHWAKVREIEASLAPPHTGRSQLGQCRQREQDLRKPPRQFVGSPQ